MRVHVQRGSVRAGGARVALERLQERSPAVEAYGGRSGARSRPRLRLAGGHVAEEQRLVGAAEQAAVLPGRRQFGHQKRAVEMDGGVGQRPAGPQPADDGAVASGSRPAAGGGLDDFGSGSGRSAPGSTAEPWSRSSWETLRTMV